jgi:hypothetical protein
LFVAVFDRRVKRGDPIMGDRAMQKANRSRSIVTDDKPSRRHPNRPHKRALKAAEMAVFVRQVGRKAQKRIEPNDRGYEDAFQRKLRQISPTDLNSLLYDDEND